MKFMGGRGLGTYFLFRMTKKGIDPFAPENPMILMGRPLTGLPCTRIHLVSKSPLTRLVGQASAGGYFGPMLKFAGYDGIIFVGKSKKPVYLHVVDGNCELKDATFLWNLNVTETIETIKKDLNDPHLQILCIGPAGERLVRFANVMTAYYAAYGRAGLGAVMGSKKLKAVAVYGTKGFPVLNREGLRKAYDMLMEHLRNMRSAKLGQNPNELYIYSRWDNPCRYSYYINVEGAKVRNFQEATHPEYWKISSYNFEKLFYVRKWACFGCYGFDKHIALIRDGKYAGTLGRSPSLENVAALGTNCGVFDPEIVLKANSLCDELGMDTISTGGVISFAMECYEKGILKKSELNDLDLKWGNGEAMLDLIKAIAYREGIGDVLAEGSRIAAERIGKGAEKYAMHVKGMELPFADPRVRKEHSPTYALGLPYVTESGARHETGCTTEQQFSSVLLDSLCICFHIFPWLSYHTYLDFFSKIIEYVVGWKVSPDDLLRIGERIWNVQRCFGVREGVSRRSDVLPERFYNEPLRSGGIVDKKEFDAALENYYAERRWDLETGIPTKAKLIELGLEEILRALEREGVPIR